MTQTPVERHEMHATEMVALAVADARLSWDIDGGTLEGRSANGILRWPAGDKERAELVLSLVCEDSTYNVVLRYSSVQRRFIGSWTTEEDDGSASCQIFRNEVGEDVELQGEWMENWRSLTWSGLLSLDEEIKGE